VHLEGVYSINSLSSLQTLQLEELEDMEDLGEQELEELLVSPRPASLLPVCRLGSVCVWAAPEAALPCKGRVPQHLAAAAGGEPSDPEPCWAPADAALAAGSSC
jgi:hypothetical protein